MIYQGPECFKTDVDGSCAKVTSKFTLRSGEPHVIVGPIGRVFYEGNDLVALVQQDSIVRIQQSYDECLRTKSDASYKRLLQACNEANDIDSETPAAYRDDLDAISLSPVSIAKFRKAERIMQDQAAVMQLRGPELQNLLEDLMYPSVLAHELVHWDIADTQCYTRGRDLFREAFLENGLSFDNSRDGSWNYMSWPDAEGEKVDALRTHKTKYQSLGLKAFEEIAAQILALEISNPPPILRHSVAGPAEIVQSLTTHLSTMGQKDFTRYCKQLIDEAYARNIPIFQLI